MVCIRADKSDGAKGTTSQDQTQHESTNEATVVDRNTQPSTSATTDSVSSNTAFYRASLVLLATAVVLVEDETGISFPARALLGSGTEYNFMTEGLCQWLNIQRRRPGNRTSKYAS